MRTKKILSILLVMIMALGVFGVTGVLAEEPNEEEAAVVLAAAEELEEEAEEAEEEADAPAEAAAPAPVAAAPVAAPAPAVQGAPKGWGDVVAAGGIAIAENKIHSRGSHTAEIVWEAFTASDTSKLDSFYNLYTTAPAGTKATFSWEYQRWIDNAWAGRTVEDNSYKALATTGAYWTMTSSALTLVIGQASAVWYGRVRARLTVDVPGELGGPFTSSWVETYLVDTGKLGEKLNEVSEELAKTDRHGEKYLNNLKAVYNMVQDILKNTKISAADVETYIVYLNNALAGKNAIGEQVGNVWKLADKNGEGFIDGTLGQGFIAFIWKVVDFVNMAKTVIDPMFAFFGEIGGFFV
ncbi:MAG: hypothetical protein LBB75_01270, partial [Oscillospiraceae bacterium]|nr:hypothetical protein [Oscillospiraceae bacterium]